MTQAATAQTSSVPYGPIRLRQGLSPVGECGYESL